jgi:hypothetical protein
MATDYVLFIHGVKNRNPVEFQKTAQGLLDSIRQSSQGRPRDLKPVFFYWGDLNVQPQKALQQGLEASPVWKNMWFRDLRTTQVLEFVGDAALYLSRHVGSQVVQRFYETALKPLQGAAPDDRLHLVTHSMGTVIFFDILFAGRWEDPRLDQDASSRGIRQTVAQIRDALFGLGAHPNAGLPIASIHTLGSPIALFSLLSVTGESSHDLTPSFREFLRRLFNLRQNKDLIWCNFIHPGDPIAYPLNGVMPMLLRDSQRYVRVRDVLTQRGNVWNTPFQQTLVPLLKGGEAHGSYWKSELVAKTIGEVMQSV